ncbi:Uncharacterized protein dnl_41450 [Desulfonema limicola]|uniref:Uncharacterized protein n=1 Tax=Desulfonema limicola TaxID=45656 RepID=A0A975GHQ6_9BACT|nr:Uncharacterized protein dnl_41450 [Desulfonema limicola]
MALLKKAQIIAVIKSRYFLFQRYKILFIKHPPPPPPSSLSTGQSELSEHVWSSSGLAAVQ